MTDASVLPPEDSPRKPFNRQKQLSVLLLILITIGCLSIWKLYKPVTTFLATSFGIGMPQVEFAYAIGGNGSSGEYNMAEPMGVAVDTNGDIYVADTLNGVVKVFDRSGKFKLRIGDKKMLTTPTDVAVSNGKVYVADGRRSRVQLFDASGQFIKTFAGPEIGKKIGAWIPTALTVSPTGDIYVTDTFYQRVIVFKSTGEFVRQFGSPGSGNGQLMYPNGIAVDRNGNAYVSDSNNQRVQVFDPAGKFLYTLGKGSGKGFSMPRGIAIGPKGFVYLTETFAHRLGVIKTADGVIDAYESVGTRGAGEGEMNFPNDAALSGNTLCIADRANNRVLVYTVDE